MNLPTKADLEHTPPRRVSAASEASIRDDEDNPLMRLVDAANLLFSQSLPTPEKKAEPQVSSCSSLASREESRDDSSKSEDGKVVLGTKADLFDSSNRKMTFAEQLMSILDDESNSDVLAWMPDGEAFTIVNHRLFAMDRMQRLFNIRNMSSFVRKLTRWGFNRLHEKSTRNSDIFKHKMFQRGRNDLVKKIRCVYRPFLKPDSATPVPALVSPIVKVGSSRANEGTTLAMFYSPEHARPAYQTGPPYGFSPPMHVRCVSHGDRSIPSMPSASRMPSLSIYRPPSTNDTFLGERGGALNEVTSNVVSAAIETLRRERPAPQHHHHDFLAIRSAQEARMLAMGPGTTFGPSSGPPHPLVFPSVNRRVSIQSGASGPIYRHLAQPWSARTDYSSSDGRSHFSYTD